MIIHILLLISVVWAGQVKKVKGQVFIDGQQLALKKKDPVKPGQTLISDHSKGYIKLKMGPSTMALRGKFKVVVPELKANKKSIAQLAYGKMRVELDSSKSKIDLKVQTPTAVAGVRGTDFFISYLPLLGESEVICFESEIDFADRKDPKNTVRVHAGQWGGHGGRFGAKIQKPISLPENVINHFKGELPF